MLTNETRKPITKLTCISEPDATRRHFRKIFLSYLCGPHQVYQNSDLRIVHIGYHDSYITDRDCKSGIVISCRDRDRDRKSAMAIVSHDRRRKVGVAISSHSMSCLIADCVIRLV